MPAPIRPTSKLALLALSACITACAANPARPSPPPLASQLTNQDLPLAKRLAAAREIAARRDASAAPALLQVISSSDLRRFPPQLIVDARAAIDAIGERVWRHARTLLEQGDRQTLDLMFGMALTKENRPIVLSLLPQIARLTRSSDPLIRQTAAEVLISLNADARPCFDDLDLLVTQQSVIGNDLAQSAYVIVSNTPTEDPRHVRAAAFLLRVRTEYEFVSMVQRGEIVGVRAALDGGASPNSEIIAPDAPDGVQYTSSTFGRMGGRVPAAVAAVLYNQAEILKLLLAAGAVVPPLDTAVRSSPEIQRILHEAGAKPDTPSETGFIPFLSPKTPPVLH